MGKNTNIEWCDDTWNAWWGCHEVHAGCDNCYARIWAERFQIHVWGIDVPRQIKPKAFQQLASLQNKAFKEGVIRTVFVGSMMDIFEKSQPLCDSKFEPVTFPHSNTNDLRSLLFRNIGSGKYPNLFFLLLTKRPSNINKMIPSSWLKYPPKNVMFGSSPVDQKTVDNQVGHLLKVKGRKFLSIEPQLGEIDLSSALSGPVDGGTWSQIDWIIQGGESGKKDVRRPFDIAWAYEMQDQCDIYGIPHFFKQIDKVQDVPQDLIDNRQFPDFKHIMING